MLTILTIRWCRRSVGESCELWEVLSEDVWQGKVRGYRLSATCVHFDARAKTAHSRSIQRQRRPGTSVAKSFAVRFAAGARLSVSVAFVGFRALFTLLYNLFYLPCKLHDLNRAFATLCAGSVARSPGRGGGVRLSTPRVRALRVRRRAPIHRTSHGDAPQPPSAYT